jgi:radical SAM superfamily enzyme YgiQ (UPF0313 family)
MSHNPRNQPKILLTGVFGPFGVDDDYGRKENIMELFHNQVTKGQGVGSFRFHHRSFGLYFLAENVDADVTVLDFPSRERFARELSQEYDIVGISFITPNMIKAQEMARLTRMLSPRSEIILGGHGAAIEGVEELIDCDHVVKGEGIRWLRTHLGQDPDAPLVHPVLPSTERVSIFGVPLPGTTASLLVPGVGCVNGCNFCSTTHFFGKKYTSFIDSGKELFETARRIADARGTDSFFVMDENFLKNRERALELIAEMERHQRFFRFHIFSSAETIAAFGLDNLVRLGVTFVWVGFESQSRQEAFAKNVDVNGRELVRQLRDRGISVLASGILCMEHHRPDNMQQDIDFLVGLESDFVQFMLLLPLPVTGVYKRHRDKGWLRTNMPFEEWHGQKYLNSRHPAFGEDEPERWLKAAFRQDYHDNSSSMYRVAQTSLRGYERLAALPERDACLERRMEQFAAQAREYCLMLPAIALYAVNEKERRRAQALNDRASRVLPRSLKEKAMVLAIIALVTRWKLRLRLAGDGIQPRTIVTHYPAGRQLPRCTRMKQAEPAAEADTGAEPDLTVSPPPEVPEELLRPGRQTGVPELPQTNRS